jgi:release factor glutamine methyltransferase
MTNQWLDKATKQLERAGIGTARLDCLVLLEDATGKDRSWLLAHPEFVFNTQQIKVLQQQLNQRIKHIPLAYIRGKTQFYGREFIINQHVLEPRPESETMIELALEVIGSRLEVRDKLQIIDVGTGSGALAITMKLELPETEVIAIDIDPKCLNLARQNAKEHDVNVQFLNGDLLEPISNLKPLTSNLLLCNLPYVPDSHTINEAAMFEPNFAIFGGPDGLDLYRKLFKQLRTFTAKPQFVLTESLPFQHAALAELAKANGFTLKMTDDFIQVFQN